MTLYGPHCHHPECSMFGCYQRGHVDFPCRDTATCWFCGPGALCPMAPDVLAVDCPECGVDAPGPDRPVAPLGSGEPMKSTVDWRRLGVLLVLVLFVVAAALAVAACHHGSDTPRPVVQVPKTGTTPSAPATTAVPSAVIVR